MTTIAIDTNLCTRCGICSKVCTMGIIDPADDDTLPAVRDGNAGMCIRCGHCEAYCPSQALILSDRPGDKVSLPLGAGTIAPDELGWYLKKRRSVRHFKKEPVKKETILGMLDIARYAASAGNGQPVEWIIVHDAAKVQEIAGLTVGWMKTLVNSNHPMSGYLPHLIRAWESGRDPICRGAPHLVAATIPEGNPMAQTDAIIALTHVDIAAPAFGVGTCWAGFVAMAAEASEPVRRAFGVPAGRKIAYVMMFGSPQYTIHGIPGRKPLAVTWR